MKAEIVWPNVYLSPETLEDRKLCYWISLRTPFEFEHALDAYVIPLFAVPELPPSLQRYIPTVEPPMPGVKNPLVCAELPEWTRPYPFQGEVIQDLVTSSWGLWAACGVGKTLMALCAFEVLYCQDQVDGMLIVGPEAGRHVWCGENSDADRWIDKGGYYVDNTSTDEAIPREGVIYVTAAKVFRDPYNTWLLDRLRTKRWVLCVDEVDQSAGAMTKRFEVLQYWAMYCRYRWLLSATPARNYPDSFWGCYRLLTGDTKITHQQWREWLRVGKSNKKWRTERVEAIGTWLSYCSTTIRKEDVAPWLPPVTNHVRKIPMRGKQKKLYAQMIGAARMSIQEAGGKQRQVVVKESLHQLSVLQSVASHPLVAGETDWSLKDIGKWDELQYILNCHHGEKVCIWSWHPDVLEWLATLLPDSVQYHGRVSKNDRTRAVERFNNDPTCRIFLGNPMAAGASLNLGAGTVRIYWDLGWSWSEYHQSGERINRITRKLPITGYALLSENSIEEMMWDALGRKMDLASRLLAGDGFDETRAVFTQNIIQGATSLWKS